MKKMMMAALIIIAVSPTISRAENPCDLVSNAWEKYRAVNYEEEKIVLEITKNGKTDQKVIRRSTKFSKDGEDKILVKFLLPKIDTGLGLLIYRHKGGDEMWLKLPSMSNARKVGVSEQSKEFGGSGITYEENRILSGEDVTGFTCELVNSQSGNRMISALPGLDVESAYGKRLYEINPEGAIVSLSFFGKDGRSQKVIRNSEIIWVHGVWRPGLVEVENMLNGNKTVMRFERNFPGSLEQVFTKDFLVSQRGLE